MTPHKSPKRGTLIPPPGKTRGLPGPRSVKLSKRRARERLALEEGAAVLVALGLDIIGEPPAPWHPVVLYGKLIRRLEQAAPRGHIPQLLYGIVMLLLAAPAALLPAAIVHQLARQVRAGAIQRGCSHDRQWVVTLSPSPSLRRSFATLRMTLLRLTRSRVNSAKGLSRWAARCFPFAAQILRCAQDDTASAHSLSMPVPTLVVKLHNRGRSAWGADSGGGYGGVMLYALIEGIGLKPCFALSMLVGAGRSVRLALERGDLPAARDALQSLVSRDCSELTTELVGAAAIESLAENLSDSVVAPLVYYALLGLPGATMYRLFNTFDSMIGYHGQYEYLGKAAAWLDDVLNVLPARLTALLIIALAPLFGGNRLRAWHIWRRDASKTASPNAGHPMAAAAGALGLQLEKVGHYTLGDNDKVMTASSVRQAEQMVWSIGCVFVFLIAVFKTLWRAQHG